MARQRNKAILFDYDRILEQESYDASLHCLSATTKMLLLSVLDPIGWAKRYIGNADPVKIREWKEQAMVELILDSCGDDLCELVASAIRDCTNVHQELINFAAGQGWSATTGNPDVMLPVSTREENLLPDDYQCDADHRYGMAVGIVTYIHTVTLEVFQKIEVATNPGELAAEVSDNIPFWEIAATGADIALWIQETMHDEYVSAYSDVVRDSIACQLFCLMAASGGCDMGFDTVFAVYLDPAFPDAPSVTDSALTWLQWLFDLALTENELIVKISSLMGLLAIRFGGGFGEMLLGLRTFRTTVALLADDTNPDWAILCDVCPETTPCDLSVGFETTQTPPIIILEGTQVPVYPHSGTRSLAGENWVSGTGRPGKTAKFRIDLDCKLNNVSFWVSMTSGSETGVIAAEFALYNSSDDLLGVFADIFVGAKDIYRQHSLPIDLAASYGTFRIFFATNFVGEQRLHVDDFVLS